MKGKKILSVMLTLAMMVSLFAGITVNAASPLTYDGTETVLFDQSFAGLSSAADAPDFTFGGNWEFTKYFSKAISPSTQSITTKNSYDLTDAAGWEFHVKMECTSRGYHIDMPGGYRVSWSHNDQYIHLYKDDTEVAKSANTAYLYDWDVDWSIKYLDGTWTVKATTTEESWSFDYADTSNPTFNGTFRVRCDYTTKFTVYNMKLTKYADSTVVKHWKYSTDFKVGDTVEKYAAEGFNLPAATTFGNGTAKPGSNCSYSFSPGGNKISGDYEFEYKYYIANGNNYYIRFNYIDSKNYYEIISVRQTSDTTTNPKRLALSKCVNGVSTVLDTIDLTNNGDYGTSTVKYTHNIVVKETEDGTKITATTTRDGGFAPIVLEATDATPFEDDGIIRITQNYNGAGSTIYYFKAHSLVSDSEKANEKPVLYTNVEVDKTFTSADTRDSIANEGFTLSAAPTGFDDTNGIYWTSGGNRILTYTNPTAVSKSYRIDAKIYRNNNNVYANFTSDGTNYYQVYVGGDGKDENNKDKYCYKLSKKVNGTTYILQHHTIDYAHTGRGGNRDLVITVDKLANGSVKIGSTWTSAAKVIGYTDTASDVGFDGLDNGAPLTSGQNVSINQGWADNVRFLSFKLTSYDTSWTEEVVNKTFTSADTHDSLAALGFSGISAAEITDADGINWLAAKNNRFVYYTNDTAFKGSYSFTFKGWRSDSGDARIQFAKSGSNYYEFVSPYNNYWTLNKVYNGVTYNLYTSSVKAGYTESGRNTSFEANVNVTAQDDGSLKINILWSTAGTLRQDITCVDTLTDTSLVDGVETDNGAPITSGTGCHVYQGWAYAKVYSFKLTKYNSSKWYDSNTGMPMFVGRFFDGSGSGVAKPVNGVIYFDYPTARLGTYKVIATLIENHEMTDIIVLDPVDLYSGKAKLFTVTDADNAVIKVFFVDAEDTLNRITEVYELKN